MMKYLTEDDFRQGLLIRRKEVSERLEAHFRKDLVAALKGMDDTYRQLQRFLQLFHVRGLLGLAQNSLGIIAGDYERDTALFEKILDKARASIDSWGGRFVFVYLPESGRYFAAARDNAIRDRLRGRVLEILAERDIPLVDVHEAFAASPDPRQMYQYPGSHFNDDGYKLTADLIANYLRAHPGRGDG
jgi:lysophospholipase L1-like esterase